MRKRCRLDLREERAAFSEGTKVAGIRIVNKL